MRDKRDKNTHSTLHAKTGRCEGKTVGRLQWVETSSYIAPALKKKEQRQVLGLLAFIGRESGTYHLWQQDFLEKAKVGKTLCTSIY